MNDALKAYVEYFETLEPRRLIFISKYFAPKARFRDPFNDVVGLRNIRAIFDHMYDTLDNPRFKVSHYAICADGYTALLRWDFLFSRSGKQHCISGCSEVMFNDKKMVISHIDYWDPADTVYQKIPILGSIIKAIRNKLSANTQ